MKIKYFLLIEMIVMCPHCMHYIWIEQINCGIFRHAIYKVNGEPINPHASEEECNRLIEKGLVWGCAMPFRLNALNQAEICGYI